MVTDMMDTSAESLLELHVALSDGNRAALEQLAACIWRPLCRRLRKKFPIADADVIRDAANDAILAYANCPRAFDPARQLPLAAFLYGIGVRILRDRLRAEKRRSVREGEYAMHLYRARAQNVEDQAAFRAAAQQVRQLLPLVCNPGEVAAMTAWLDDGDTVAVAAELGLSSLSPSEQEREKSRLVARVIRRLQRHFASTTKAHTGVGSQKNRMADV